MSTTLQDGRDVFYAILRELEDTKAYPLVLVDLLLNAAQQKFCSGRIINPVTKEEARKGKLHFLQTEEYYSNKPTTSLTQDTTIGAIELFVNDTTPFSTAGKLYIAGNMITYTGLTATSFTGVTGVKFPFKAGTQVSVAFDLPADYMSPINLIYNNKMKLEQKLYDDIFEDLNSWKGTAKSRNDGVGLYDSPYRVNPFYTLKDASYLLIFNYNNADDMIRLRYEKKPTFMTNSTDLFTIDNDVYARSIPAYLAVGEMLYNRGEEGRAAELLSFAVSQAREAYDYYNNQEFEDQSGVHYKMIKGKLNI